MLRICSALRAGYRAQRAEELFGTSARDATRGIPGRSQRTRKVRPGSWSNGSSHTLKSTTPYFLVLSGNSGKCQGQTGAVRAARFNAQGELEPGGHEFDESHEWNRAADCLARPGPIRVRFMVTSSTSSNSSNSCPLCSNAPRRLRRLPPDCPTRRLSRRALRRSPGIPEEPIFSSLRACSECRSSPSEVTGLESRATGPPGLCHRRSAAAGTRLRPAE